MADIPEFDPTAPFEPVKADIPEFDPSKPFETAGKNKSPTLGERGEDFVRSTVAGVGRGVTGAVGLPGTVADLTSKGLGWATGTDPESWRDKKENRLPTGEDVTKAAEKYAVSGKFYKPQYKTGEYGESIGEMLPWAVTGPGGIVRRILTQAVAPGVASEAAHQATEGTAAEIPATVAGAFLGTAGAQKAAARLRMSGAYKGAPAAAELEDSVNARYAHARELGVEIQPAAAANALKEIRETAGIDEIVAPRTNALIEKTISHLETTDKPATFDSFEKTRRQLGKLLKDPNEYEAAKDAQKGMHNYLADKVKQGDLISGDAKQLAGSAKVAREEAAANFRMRAIESIREQAELVGEKGGNVERAYRDKLSAFVRPDKKGRSPAMKEGFTKEEIKEIRNTAKIASFPSVLRAVGTLAGHHVGTLIGAGSVVGAAHTGDPRYLEGLAAVGVGYGAKRLGSAIMRARAAKAARMTAARSPLASEMNIRRPVPGGNWMPSALRAPLGTLPEI